MPMESPSALMVTGHRELSHPELVAERLDEVLARLAPTVAISGGAQGADSLFASVALARGVPLRLMLPNRWYRCRYPAAVSDEVVAAAQRVEMVVDRPDVADWRDRWEAERWSVDNFVRNAAMVAAADAAVVVSARHPRVLVGDRRGGTAACLRDWRRRRPGTKVLWVPDDPGAPMRWTPLTPAD